MTREEIFAYVLARYGTEPECPWLDDPESVVLRHERNGKWYGIFLLVPRARLGLPGEGCADILNLKLPPAMVYGLQTEPGYLPAYHMNKANWITVLLESPLPDGQLQYLIDTSYDLTRPRMRARRE